NLIEIYGGKVNAVSQLGEGSKFWFTWNVDILPSQISYALPSFIIMKHILIIHPLESARNAMLKYLKVVKKVDAFDTPCKAIEEAKNYKKLNNRSAYDIVFIRLNKKNEEDVMKAVLELREINDDDLLVIF